MLKRLVIGGIGGWILLLLAGFLVAMLPNNRALAKFLWVYSILLFCLTGVFVVLTTARFFGRLLKRHGPPTAVGSYVAQPPPTREQRRRMVLNVSLALVGVAVFGSLLLTYVEHQIRSSPVYQASVAKARESPFVIEAVGQPLDAGWFNSGTITQYSDGRGRAKLTIPIAGPKGRGKIIVDAARISGNWRFFTLQFVAAGKATGVDLLRPPS